MRALLLALVLVPGAAAVELSMTPPDLLQPDEEWSSELVIEFPCEEVLASGPGPDRPIMVRFTTEVAGLSFAFTLPEPVNQAECIGLEGSVVRRVPVTLSASMEVPALETHFVRIEAGIEGDVGELELPIETVFVPRIEVKVPVSIKQAGPQKQIPYELHIENFSNARVTVQFRADPPPGKGHIVVPDDLVLDGPGGERAKATAVVTYSTPYQNGPNNHEDPLLIYATPVASEAPHLEGETTAVNLLGRTEGVYVPGPGVLLVPTLLLAVALRRRA